MRVTREQLAAMQARVKGADKPKVKKPRMNKTEGLYALTLEAMKRTGEVHDYKFEAVNFRLANNTYYRIDFMVVRKVSELFVIEFHEVKGGHIREDAIIKFKVVREMHPYITFKMMQYRDKVWNEIYVN